MMTNWQVEPDFVARCARLKGAAFALHQFNQAEALDAFERARQIGFGPTRKGFQFGK
jgi:hypothetical protein